MYYMYIHGKLLFITVQKKKSRDFLIFQLVPSMCEIISRDPGRSSVLFFNSERPDLSKNFSLIMVSSLCEIISRDPG
jgi:hypothetical protein